MQLSRTERWILSNQYRILEALCPNEADVLARKREALESGYELNYEGICDYISSEDNSMSAAECREVLDILDMFSAMKEAYTALQDKSDIEERVITFRGFDGNNETKQLAYARYICDIPNSRFADLTGGGYANSHLPLLSTYRRMLIEWKHSTDKYSLTKDDIVRITFA